MANIKQSEFRRAVTCNHRLRFHSENGLQAKSRACAVPCASPHAGCEGCPAQSVLILQIMFRVDPADSLLDRLGLGLGSDVFSGIMHAWSLFCMFNVRNMRQL